MMSLSSSLGRYVSELSPANLPPSVVEKAKLCLLNSLCIGLLGKPIPETAVARRVALESGSASNGATLFFSNHAKVSIADAAFGNAVLFHGRGQDDTCGAAHLGAVIVPTLLALVEAKGLPLDTFLSAMIAGYQVGGCLENILAASSTPRGFRSTPLFGSIAAAAAAAKLLGKDAGTCASAIGNACSMTGGLQQTFSDSTNEWRYQGGWAARNGLLSAQLAIGGSLTAPHAIEGASGLANVFAGKPLDASILLDQLNNEWALDRVTFKPFPVCAFNQTPVIAAMELRRRVNERPITNIKMRMNPYEANYPGMVERGPFSSFPGTVMSAPFCVALTLVRGEPTMDGLNDFVDKDVLQLAQKVSVIADEAIPRLSCIIEARTGDGSSELVERLATTQDFAFGWDEVSRMNRKLGNEGGASPASFDIIEGFVSSLPSSDLASLHEVFR
jgi:2-methylcitrate dehydratase PrpD